MSRERVAVPRHRSSFETLDVRRTASAPARPRPEPVRRRRADVAVAGTALALALWTTARLWLHVHSRVLGRNPGDHTLFQWMLAYGVRVFTHSGDPFRTDRMNVPDGVNVAANTHVLGLSVPLAPVTVLFGPDVSFAVLVTLAFALTAFGWYHVFSRFLVDNRLAAAIGGLFCGFAPALVAHANGQPNQVAQFVVPYLVLFALRLHRRPVRDGVVLGLLAAYQALVNEEILFITALAVGLFVALYAYWRRPVPWRPYARGLAVAAGTGLVLLAYPLWVQFTGPGSYRGLPFEPDRYVSDLLSFVTYPRQSLGGGDPSMATRLSPSPDEDNASFGWPLVLVCAVVAAWLWRRVMVRAAVLTALVMSVLSLGPNLRVRGHATGIPAPFALLAHIPPFTFAVPGRFAMVAVPVIGMLLALGTATVAREPRKLRLLWAGALAGALVPLIPMPLYTSPRAPVPAFFADGTWRAYVPAGRTVVPVPLPSYQTPDALYWQATQGLDLALPRGYFLGPGADGAAMFGAPARPTATKLYAISVLPKVPRPAVGADTPLGTLATGRPAPTTVTDTDRAHAVDDLRYWRAAIVVLAPQRNDDKLRGTVTDLLGYPPRWVDGVWLWDVGALSD